MKKLNPKLTALVALLNRGHYHSGRDLGDALQITRSAVWKLIKKLRDYGIAIQTSKGRGYQLNQPLLLLDEKKLRQSLEPLKIPLTVFESIDSTHKQLRLTENKENQIYLAEQQTQGKGRLNRDWHSPFGQNIYLSLAYAFNKDLSELAGLSIAVSLATIKAIEVCLNINDLKLKWPNDILYQQAKLAGNLIEIQAESHGSCRAVMGIGLNVNMLSTEDKINQPWTSLNKINGNYIDRNIIASVLMKTLIEYLDTFSQSGIQSILKQWSQYDYLLNQKVQLQNFDKKINGTAKGINEQGQLLLERVDGTLEAFSAGDCKVG